MVVGARLSEYLPKNALKILLYTVLVTVSWHYSNPLNPHSSLESHHTDRINKSGTGATK
ncbi:MAG UNVERIFIED_CONTAM: hypothetical protein LVR29_21020 [Microcystis novacekii LVE1205-3]